MRNAILVFIILAELLLFLAGHCATYQTYFPDGCRGADFSGSSLCPFREVFSSDLFEPFSTLLSPAPPAHCGGQGRPASLPLAVAFLDASPFLIGIALLCYCIWRPGRGASWPRVLRSLALFPAGFAFGFWGAAVLVGSYRIPSPELRAISLIGLIVGIFFGDAIGRISARPERGLVKLGLTTLVVLLLLWISSGILLSARFDS